MVPLLFVIVGCTDGPAARPLPEQDALGVPTAVRDVVDLEGLAKVGPRGAGPVEPPPLRPMLLQVGEVAAGGVVSARIAGANPHASVTVVAGPPGPPLCLAKWGGICIDVAKVGTVKAVTVTADDQGKWRGTFPVPAGLAEGTEVVFQAIVGPGANSYVSHAVSRTILPVGTGTVVTPVNILVIIADDLGADALGTYGYPGSQPTPEIDALAAESVLFRTAWGVPECNPSRTTFLTGRMPRRTGASASGASVKLAGGVEVRDNALDFTQLTIPEILDLSPQLDYTTQLVGKWGLGSIDTLDMGIWPVLHGFDSWSGLGNNVRNPVFPWAEPTADYFVWEKWVDGAPTVSTTYQTFDTTDDAIQAMATLPEPWFLVVAYQAPHAPYHVPPASVNPNPGILPTDPVDVLYPAMVGSLDVELGRLLAGVPPLTNGTMTVFFGDNGTPGPALDEARNLTPVSRAKGSVYDGGVHVPLLVSGPMVAAPGRESDAFVSLADLMPTFAELVGVDVAVLPGVLDTTAPLALDGMSLLGVLADEAATLPRENLYSEVLYPSGPEPKEQDLVTVRNAGYKLVRDRLSGEDQFFDYALATVNEGPNLVECGMDATQQAAMDALAAELDAIIDAMPFDAVPVVLPPFPGPSVEFETLEEFSGVPCP